MKTASPPHHGAWRQAMALMIGGVLWAAVSSEAENDSYFDETQATTLFSFDSVSIPFSQGLKLEMRSPQKHPANPVVKRGGPDAPDSWAVQFYGSVIRDGDTFRMWYVAAGKERVEKIGPRSAPWRVAYAESSDGVNWTKPNLGLVDYYGSTDNNLVKMNPRIGTVNVKVLKDPDDAKPNRLYKMVAHVWFPKNDVRLGTLAPYTSRDGLTWTFLGGVKPIDAEIQQDDMVIPPLHYEPAGGLYKWDGLFYSSGQNATPSARPYHGRVTRSFVSPDFETWHGASAIALVRDAQHDLLGPGRSREGEQVHEGISVWNRGNVLLGIFGVWHGAKEWRDVTIDLGLAISNDGLHFREPMHEWIFLKRGEDGQWDQGGLLQGQGFENVGDQTYIYYGAWDPRRSKGSPARGGVGIATLPRDRFGDLVVNEATKGKGNYQMPEIISEFITAPIQLKGDGPHSFFVNVDGLGEEAVLKIELLNRNTTPLAPFSGENEAVVRRNGFQTPIEWHGHDQIYGLPSHIRIKVSFEGKRNTNIRFSALYVQ